MTRTRRLVTLVLLALPLAVATHAGSVPPVASPQVVANLHANWADGETWSRYLDATGETEVGLGLQPAGKTGTTFLAFSARWPGRVAKGGPRGVHVQVGTPAFGNPLVVRTPTLTFVADAGTKNQAMLDLSSRLRVDQPRAGEMVSNGIGTIELKELARIAQATTLEGTVLGLDVVYSPAQRLAIRDFAKKIAVK